MHEYFIAYHGGKMPENLEEHMGKFMEWVGNLGKAVVMPGMPLGRAKIVSADGVSDDGEQGFPFWKPTAWGRLLK